MLLLLIKKEILASLVYRSKKFTTILTRKTLVALIDNIENIELHKLKEVIAIHNN